MNEVEMNVRRALVDFTRVRDSVSEITEGDTVWISLLDKVSDIVSKLTMLSKEKVPEKKETFVVAVCGHFSSGKSSFINAVIGTDMCPVDTEITTKANTRFSYGDFAIYKIGKRKKQVSIGEYQEIVQSPLRSDAEVNFEVHLPNPILKRFNFLDTPGRGADDESVGEENVGDYLRDSESSSDDLASDAACEEADCIIYLSQPKNIHEEDEAFLKSHMAMSKPVLVVMPQVDRLKEDGPQLVSAYQDAVEKIRKDNNSISSLYCCGGFGRKKKNPSLKEESLQKLIGGLDDLYNDTMLRRRAYVDSELRRRGLAIKKIIELISALEKSVIALKLTPMDIQKFDDNLRKYYSEEEGYSQWLNLLIADVNMMISHFRDRAAKYCYRKEYDLTTNRAAIRTQAIRLEAKSRVLDMIGSLKTRVSVVLKTKLNSKEAYDESILEINGLETEISSFVAEAVDWWDQDHHDWPGDLWYWWNSDVDKVGHDAVWNWANGNLTKSCQKITLSHSTINRACRIESIVSTALKAYRKLRDERQTWISNLDVAVQDFRQKLKG